MPNISLTKVLMKRFLSKINNLKIFEVNSLIVNADISDFYSLPLTNAANGFKLLDFSNKTLN